MIKYQLQVLKVDRTGRTQWHTPTQYTGIMGEAGLDYLQARRREILASIGAMRVKLGRRNRRTGAQRLSLRQIPGAILSARIVSYTDTRGR